MNFAQDNDLQVAEACLMPRARPPSLRYRAEQAKKPPEGGFFALLAAHPFQTAEAVVKQPGLVT